MTERIRGIVIRTLRHSDRYDIVTLLTESRGLMSLLSRAPSSGGSGSRRGGASRKGRLPLLTLVETDLPTHSPREMQILGKVGCPLVWRSIYFHPDKSALAFFISDFLYTLLRSAPPDTAVFRYVLAALQALDDTELSVANFHICFMLGMLPLLGIQPDCAAWRPGSLFDMRDGAFVAGEDVRALHNDLIGPEMASRIPLFCRMTFANMHKFRLRGSDRSELIEWIMRYYAIHLPVSAKLKSLEILRALY